MRFAEGGATVAPVTTTWRSSQEATLYPGDAATLYENDNTKDRAAGKASGPAGALESGRPANAALESGFGDAALSDSEEGERFTEMRAQASLRNFLPSITQGGSSTPPASMDPVTQAQAPTPPASPGVRTRSQSGDATGAGRAATVARPPPPQAAAKSPRDARKAGVASSRGPTAGSDARQRDNGNASDDSSSDSSSDDDLALLRSFKLRPSGRVKRSRDGEALATAAVPAKGAVAATSATFVADAGSGSAAVAPREHEAVASRTTSPAAGPAPAAAAASPQPRPAPLDTAVPPATSRSPAAQRTHVADSGDGSRQAASGAAAALNSSDFPPTGWQAFFMATLAPMGSERVSFRVDPSSQILGIVPGTWPLGRVHVQEGRTHIKLKRVAREHVMVHCDEDGSVKLQQVPLAPGHRDVCLNATAVRWHDKELTPVTCVWALLCVIWCPPMARAPKRRSSFRQSRSTRSKPSPCIATSTPLLLAAGSLHLARRSALLRSVFFWCPSLARGHA